MIEAPGGVTSSDLTTVLSTALEALQTEGHGPVLFIGSDCPELPSSAIERALAVCQDPGHAYICGADDGGYVLLGLPAEAPADQVFAGVHWSAQDTAASQTEVLEACGLRVVRGETHSDIDELSDLLALKGRLEALSRREREEICPRVAAWLGALNYGAVNHFVRHASPERAGECGHNAEVTEATVRRSPRCARDS